MQMVVPPKEKISTVYSDKTPKACLKTSDGSDSSQRKYYFQLRTRYSCINSFTYYTNLKIQYIPWLLSHNRAVI
jgi:hypothetical protein